MSATVAVVDCGSNSTRLLVASADGAGTLRMLAREQIVTRLGQGVDGNGHLADQAIGRTVDAIAGFADIWRGFGVDEVRIVATSAVRDATDRDRFASAVEDRVGYPLQVLSGDQEAFHAFAGAVGAAQPPTPTMVLDIGGGSTELIVGEDVPAASISLQLGCVRLTERCLPGDPPSGDAFDAARAVVEAQLDTAQPVIAPHEPISLVAVAGTATTLAALHLGLVEHDPDRVHGLVMDRADIDGLLDRMRRLTAVQIAGLGPVQAGREDVLLAGTLILSCTMARFGLEQVVISEGDLLDGVATFALRR